jgi:uncharacterized protein
VTKDEPSIDPTLPEVVQNFLRSGARLEEIRLDACGRWTHEGLDFENQRVIALFSRSIARTPGGTWVLEIGGFTYPIVVDDTPHFVHTVRWNDDPPTISLADGTSEILDLESLTYRSGGRLYCTVKNGAFRARFLRHAYHSVVDVLEERDREVFVVVAGQEIALTHLDSEDS